MFLGLVTLLTALSISGVSAFYSIVGLTAIFAAAHWPIIIMGSVLETGKVVTTLWLHYNWKRAAIGLKLYLSAAVIILMFITSMGIFGFLSKAHLDQGVPTGEIQAQVALLDAKIQTQQDNIESSQTASAQLNAQVDQLLSRTTDANGASKAANLRRAQREERSQLQTDIDTAQAEISKLREARAPIATSLRKVDAEVGPIKYIAALVYGDTPDQNLLEKAVRWVIIVIVSVFDPLAIMLLLAATTSLDWAKLDRLVRRQEQILDTHNNDIEKLIDLEKSYQDLIAQADEAKLKESNLAIDIAALYEQLAAAEGKSHDAIDALVSKLHDALNTANEAEVENAELNGRIKAMEAELASSALATTKVQDKLVAANEMHKITQVSTTVIQDEKSKVEAELSALVEEYTSLAEQKKQADELLETTTEYSVTNSARMNTEITALQIQVSNLQEHLQTLIGTAEELVVTPLTTLPSAPTVTADIIGPTRFPVKANASFGIKFPITPNKGDLFLRVDMLPTKLFKWSGQRWIEVDKANTDTYTHDEGYIKLLVARLGSGEYTLEDLTQTEQEEVASFLRTTDGDERNTQ